MLDRRTVLASSLLASSLVASRAAAQPPAPETVKLWPKDVPGGQSIHVPYREVPENPEQHTSRSVSGVTEPTVTLHKVQADTAILVLPGGGFTRMMADKEGEDVCAMLNAHAISAGTLLYRLPGDGWNSDASVADAKRALLILAERTGAKRVGVMGFSAGGTVAAAVATRWDEALYPPVDATDALAIRPGFMALGYPWLNLPAVPKGFTSMYKGMNAKAPPAFFFLAADDHTVTPDNSIKAFRQLRELHVPAALHVFESGDHGFALRAPPNSPQSAWPELFLRWGKAGGHIL